MQDTQTNNNTYTVTSTDSGKPHEIVPGMVSIIMPVYIHAYQLLHYTGHALGSVKEHTDKIETPYEIVLVDNGSPITLPDPMMYKVDKYVRNEANFGVTKAWNQGIRVSQGEYICLLNNDTMVFDDWLKDLKDCLEYVDFVMATPMYGEPFARAVEAKKKSTEWKQKMVGESFSDFKDFACVLTRRSVFDSLGLFDERFVNYAQDSDFFRMMDQNGVTWASTKRVPIFHIIGGTSTGISETSDVMNEDKERFRLKWEQPQNSPS